VPKEQGSCVRIFFHFLILLLLPLHVSAALTVSVTLDSGQPGSIFPGEQTALKITLSNSSESAAITGVAFNSALPAGFPDGLKITAGTSYQCTDPSGPSTGAGAGTLTATIR